MWPQLEGSREQGFSACGAKCRASHLAGGDWIEAHASREAERACVRDLSRVPRREERQEPRLRPQAESLDERGQRNSLDGAEHCQGRGRGSLGEFSWLRGRRSTARGPHERGRGIDQRVSSCSHGVLGLPIPAFIHPPPFRFLRALLPRGS